MDVCVLQCMIEQENGQNNGHTPAPCRDVVIMEDVRVGGTYQRNEQQPSTWTVPIPRKMGAARLREVAKITPTTTPTAWIIPTPRQIRTARLGEVS